MWRVEVLCYFLNWLCMCSACRCIVCVCVCSCVKCMFAFVCVCVCSCVKCMFAFVCVCVCVCVGVCAFTVSFCFISSTKITQGSMMKLLHAWRLVSITGIKISCWSGVNMNLSTSLFVCLNALCNKAYLLPLKLFFYLVIHISPVAVCGHYQSFPLSLLLGRWGICWPHDFLSAWKSDSFYSSAPPLCRPGLPVLSRVSGSRPETHHYRSTARRSGRAAKARGANSRLQVKPTLKGG